LAESVAARIRDACASSGFFSIAGHQFPAGLIRQAFEQTRKFHSLDQGLKDSLLLNQADWPVRGVGYLPYANYLLPARDKSNLNESFIIKRDHRISLDDNRWPDENLLPGFRQTISSYAERLELLAKQLLPLFARALNLPAEYFKEAFETPLFRLRMTRYRPAPDMEPGQFGIAPHVDTSFFTIVAQDSPGLVVFSEPRQCWVRVPAMENVFVINSGELLKQWSNDFFVSARHFAWNRDDTSSRYSMPFFFNARPDYVMHCLPSCWSADNPAKYPPISYLQSQGVVQGE